MPTSRTPFLGFNIHLVAVFSPVEVKQTRSPKSLGLQKDSQVGKDETEQLLLLLTTFQFSLLAATGGISLGMQYPANLDSP